MVRAMERAKIEGVSFHSLRHQFAPMLITGLKQDVETVARQLGHANSSITLGVYSHEWDKRQSGDELRNAMANTFGHVLDGVARRSL